MGMESIPTNDKADEANRLEMQRKEDDAAVEREVSLSAQLEGQLKEAQEASNSYQEQHRGEAYSSASDAELNRLQQKVTGLKQDLENSQSRLLNLRKGRGF